MSIELAADDVLSIVSIIVSASSFFIAIYAQRYVKRQGMIQNFFSVANSFFTPETRDYRRVLRGNEKLTELKGQEDPKELEKEDLPKFSEKNTELWEVVSAYNRLAFVLDQSPLLKDEFLKWDAEAIIDMWRRTRPYIFQTREKDKARKKIAEKFEKLAEEAKNYVDEGE